MKSWILAMPLTLMAFPSHGTAQSKDALVGTWKLISATNTTEKGEVIEDAYCRNPTGLLTYTADGRMMAIITNGGRKRLSADSFSALVEERAKAFATLLAYAGRYTVTSDKVIHHIEVAWTPNLVNTDRVRFIRDMPDSAPDDNILDCAFSPDGSRHRSRLVKRRSWQPNSRVAG